MAQRRLFNFEENDDTLLLSRHHLAPIPYGRYRGYDYDAAASTGLNLVLNAAVTGYTEVDDALATVGPYSMARTKQGVSIFEDADIVIPVNDNFANANPRIDLIVVEHEYVAVTGGVDATYVVIEGVPAATPAVPALTFPNKQVILGTLYWPANAPNLDAAGVIYTQVESPNFNSKTAHFLSEFMELLTYSSGTETLSSIISANKYRLANINANYADVANIDLPFANEIGESNEVNHFSIYTLQKLRLISGGNLAITGTDVIHIEAGETVTFIDLKNTALGGGNSLYLVARGNEVRKDKLTKMFAQLLTNQGTAAMDGGTGEVTLDGKGNYYRVEYDFSATGIAGLTSFTPQADTADPLSSAGGLLVVQFVTNTGTNTVTMLDGFAVGGSFKPILTGLNTDMEINSGDIFILLERETDYLVIGRTGDTVNLTKLYNAYVATIQAGEKQWSGTQVTPFKSLTLAAFDDVLGILNITNDGNSFSVLVPPADTGGVLNDIKIVRGAASPATAPTGLVINVKFVHSGFAVGINEPFYINTDAGTSNIASSIDDAIKAAGGSAGVLHIQEGVYPYADIYTFRKTASKWEIVSVAPDPGLYARVKTLEAANVIEAWKVVGAAGQPAFANSFTTYAPSPMRFRKNYEGLVKLSGVASVPAVGWVTGQIITTLGAGYRPTQEEQYLSANNSDIDAVVINIDTSGNIRAYSTNNLSGMRIFFSNVSFYNS